MGSRSSSRSSSRRRPEGQRLPHKAARSPLLCCICCALRPFPTSADLPVPAARQCVRQRCSRLRSSSSTSSTSSSRGVCSLLLAEVAAVAACCMLSSSQQLPPQPSQLQPPPQQQQQPPQGSLADAPAAVDAHNMKHLILTMPWLWSQLRERCRVGARQAGGGRGPTLPPAPLDLLTPGCLGELLLHLAPTHAAHASV